MANDTENLENTQPYKSPSRILGEAQSALVALDPKDPSFPALQAAIVLLQRYTGIGDPEDTLKAFRASMILDHYIQQQAKPVRDAWIAYLKEEKAL